MLELAVKAPSGHNTQPWLFRVGEDRIEIFPDLDRALPVVDPDHRELFISLGCAAENLYMAAEAKGYIPEMIVSETGGITMLLKKRQTAKETVNFVREIVSRQTNRGVYTGEEISADQLDDLTKDLSLIDEYPTLILRLGYTKRKMPYSPRKPWREKLIS